MILTDGVGSRLAVQLEKACLPEVTGSTRRAPLGAFAQLASEAKLQPGIGDDSNSVCALARGRQPILAAPLRQLGRYPQYFRKRRRCGRRWIKERNQWGR
ncbi:MAG TPA: hypothetical protein VNM72_08890 [Blastocatellia bacterium]|nr:hypothetical protein [Blastocatellia bacterium]